MKILFYVMFIVAVVIPEVRASCPTHVCENNSPKTQYIYLKEDDRAKYVIGGALIVGAIWCVAEKCWKEIPKTIHETDLDITPKNLSDR